MIINPIVQSESMIHTFSIVAAAMGFMMTFVVFSNRKYLSNLYLSFVLLFLSVSLLFPDTPNLMSRYPVLLFTGVFNYLYGPTMLRYVYHTIYAEYPPRFSFWIHSIPAMVYALFCLYPVFFLTGEDIQFYIHQTMSGEAPWPVIFFNFVSAISLAFYTAGIVRIIYLHRTRLSEVFHRPGQKEWFLSLIIVFVVLVGGGFVYTYAESYYPRILNHVYLVQLAAASGFMVMIAFFALKNPTILTWEQVRDKIRVKLNLSSSQIHEIKNKILQSMEQEKLYLDETLDLRTAAERIEVHPNVLSFIINDEFKSNFKQFVNEYRCDYFVELLKTRPEIPILHLVYEAGFPSKTTFHDTFNKKYQMTPTQYREKLLKK